jgi:hypothetical protein
MGLAVLAGACTPRRVAVSVYDTGEPNWLLEWRGPARDGRCVQRFPGGTVALETRYRLGLRDGPWRLWHANGQPAVAGTFVNGLRAGSWTEWAADGTKVLEGSWHAGEKSGTWSEYDEHGVLVAREVFVDGTRLRLRNVVRRPPADGER